MREPPVLECTDNVSSSIHTLFREPTPSSYLTLRSHTAAHILSGGQTRTRYKMEVVCIEKSGDPYIEGNLK